MSNIKIDLEKIKTADFRTEDQGRVAAAEIAKRREEKKEQPSLFNKLVGKKEKAESDYKVSEQVLNTQNLYEEMDRAEAAYVNEQIAKEKHKRHLGAAFSYTRELVILVGVAAGVILGWAFLNGHSAQINKATDVVFEKADEVVNSTSSNKEMKKEMDAYNERIKQNQQK